LVTLDPGFDPGFLHHNFDGRKEKAKGQMVGVRMELSKKSPSASSMQSIFTATSSRS
jgi:hypothetical protein